MTTPVTGVPFPDEFFDFRVHFRDSFSRLFRDLPDANSMNSSLESPDRRLPSLEVHRNFKADAAGLDPEVVDHGHNPPEMESSTRIGRAEYFLVIHHQFRYERGRDGSRTVCRPLDSCLLRLGCRVRSRLWLLGHGRNDFSIRSRSHYPVRRQSF